MRENGSHDAMGKLQRCLKRAFDIVGALIGLIICSPLFLFISILITYQSNGPIIFRQIRIGYKGRPFAIFKFRTMSSVVEEEGPQLVAKCDSSNSTRLEQFLRGHHLDELPQLWNVLRGDMSSWVRALNVSSLSTRLSNRPTAISSSIRCDRDLLLRQHSTMVIPIQWRKCFDEWRWTSITWNIAPCGWTFTMSLRRF